MKKNITFESAMERLAQVVDQLESGTLTLEESMKLFEEGTALSAHCYQKLSQAEQKIREISELEHTYE
jgi:exodeoxyribonuclease VII small subunit